MWRKRTNKNTQRDNSKNMTVYEAIYKETISIHQTEKGAKDSLADYIKYRREDWYRKNKDIFKPPHKDGFPQWGVIKSILLE